MRIPYIEYLIINLFYFSDARLKTMEDSVSLNSTNSSLPAPPSEKNSSRDSNLVLVRVGVPELSVEKCLQYQIDLKKCH